MSDTETLTNDKKYKTSQEKCKYDEGNSDFPSMGVELFKKINFKVALFMFLIGLIILSDMFIEKFIPIEYQDGTNNPNTKGTFLQLLVMVILYIIVDLLVQGNIL